MKTSSLSVLLKTGNFNLISKQRAAVKADNSRESEDFLASCLLLVRKIKI